MEKNYIFTTKDGKHQVNILGYGGEKRMGSLLRKNKNLKVSDSSSVTTIITDFEDLATLEKEILY